jgi:hypothetical protein
MSEPDSEEFHWRETYHILFNSANRPTVSQVERALGELGRQIHLDELTADDDGFFESVIVQSPDDYAALEIDYESGEAVEEQAGQLAKQLRGEADRAQLQKLVAADSRLDVMHFERIVDERYSDDENDDMLDPGCLLMVVEALVRLTRGIAIDPAAGAILP